MHQDPTKIHKFESPPILQTKNSLTPFLQRMPSRGLGKVESIMSAKKPEQNFRPQMDIESSSSEEEGPKIDIDENFGFEEVA